MGVVTCGVATQLCGYDVATSHVVTPTLGIITLGRRSNPFAIELLLAMKLESLSRHTARPSCGRFISILQGFLTASFIDKGN